MEPLCLVKLCLAHPNSKAGAHLWGQTAAGAGASPPPVTPCVCMTSTTNCTSAASWAARANDSPAGIQSLSFTELHSAPNDGRDSNHPTRLWLLHRAGRAGRALQRHQQHLCSPCLSGGEKQHRLFLLQTQAPHLSKEKSQLLFFP